MVGDFKSDLQTLASAFARKDSTFGEIADLFSGKIGREAGDGRSAGELNFVHAISDYPAEMLLWKEGAGCGQGA